MVDLSGDEEMVALEVDRKVIEVTGDLRQRRHVKKRKRLGGFRLAGGAGNA
jgi:hypothetical protein